MYAAFASNSCTQGASRGGSGSTGNSSDSASSGSGAPVIVEPPSQCLASNAFCKIDVDCASLGGYRCNTQLQPPQCEQLYCGPENTKCSSDDVCKQSLKCHNGGCNACNLCGNLCEVDFNTNPANCGGCNKTVPAGHVCVNGVASCPNGTTDCGGKCIDLATDPDNCGACGMACPVENPSSVAACGKPCEQPQNACGCVSGHCKTWLYADTDATINSCSSVCAKHGLKCELCWISYGMGTCETKSCDVIPPSMEGGSSVSGHFCRCAN